MIALRQHVARRAFRLFTYSKRPHIGSRSVSSTLQQQASPALTEDLNGKGHPPTPLDSSATFDSFGKRKQSNDEYWKQQNSLLEKSRPDKYVSITQDPLSHILSHPSASIVLRDACKCSKCKDPGTSQREFNIAQIPANLKPSSAEQDVRGNWVIRWANDMPGWEDHTSIFTPHEIDRLTSFMAKDHHTSTRLWTRSTYEREKLTIPYSEYMTTSGLAKTLHAFSRHGLVFITDVPNKEASIPKLAEHIAPMKSTFYATTWDIRSVPDAKNVAFTSKYLGFHSDLVYLKEPPTMQFLHCLQNSCTGGESRFVDQFAALDTLYSEDPELAQALTQTKLRYEYDNDGYFYTDIKPIVQPHPSGSSYTFPRRRIHNAQNPELSSVYRMFWAPQFLGSILDDGINSAEHITKSLAAMKKYASILEREDLVYETKMEEGTCVIFDNLRVLHARNAFDVNSGRRWLKGTYVDAQDLWSVEVRLRDEIGRLEREGQIGA